MANEEKNLKEGRLQLLPIVGGILILLGIYIFSMIISNSLNIKEELTKGDNVITVTGAGEIYAKPDIGIVSFAVVNEAKTVAEAMAENTKHMNAAIEAVKSQGVEEKDLKTVGFNIYPRYEWREKTTIPPYYEGERVLAGYEVRQSLQVKIRDLTKVGNIIQEATKAGANEVSDLQLTIDKEDELKTQARAEAIEQAKSKAKELASQLGIGLGRIKSFSESGYEPIYYRTDYAKAESAAGMGGAAPDIQTGENKIEVNVVIVYEVR